MKIAPMKNTNCKFSEVSISEVFVHYGEVFIKTHPFTHNRNLCVAMKLRNAAPAFFGGEINVCLKPNAELILGD